MNSKASVNSPSSGTGPQVPKIKEVKPIKIPAGTDNGRERIEPSNDTTVLKRTYEFVGMFNRILGWKFSYDWKNNPKHMFACVLYFVLLFQLVFSQVKFFNNGEYNRILEVFAVYGICSSVAQKIWMFARYHEEIAALHKFTYKITRHSGKHMTEKIKTQQSYVLKFCKCTVLLAVFGQLLYLSYPISEFVYYGNLIPLMPIEITFLDTSKTSHFLIFNTFLSATGLWCFFVLLTIIYHFTAMILNGFIQVALIEDDIRQLDNLWREPKTSSLVERHLFLRNICVKCQDKDKYMEKIKSIFDGPLFYYFMGAYASQIVCLYEIEMENWVPGYGVACGNFIEMLIYCVIGSESSIVNDRLYYVLTQSSWYTYDMYSQKIFLDLLNSCMNSKELWIGPVAPLSVATGVQMVRSIYTYYKFLTEVVH